MFFEKIKIHLMNKNELMQIRLFDIPIFQYEIDKNENKTKNFCCPILRKKEKITDKPVVYLKINSKNYSYSIFCIYRWINIVNAMDYDFYIICDDKDLKRTILKSIKFHNDNIKFIKSDRKHFKKLIKISCTKNWEKAGYAHLTTYLHAQKNGIKEFWNIDADDTAFFEKPEIVANALKEVEKYTRENNIHAISLDMHRSAYRGLHWSFGITFTRANIDIKKELNTFKTTEWQEEFHKKKMNNPSWDSNLDTFFTYLKDKNILKIESFNINNLYFIHFGNCFLGYLYRTIQITKNDNIMHYPFLTAFDSKRKEIPIFDDIINFDTGIDENSSKTIMQEIMFRFDNRIEDVRTRYDKYIKEEYENNK